MLSPSNSDDQEKHNFFPIIQFNELFKILKFHSGLMAEHIISDNSE